MNNTRILQTGALVILAVIALFVIKIQPTQPQDQNNQGDKINQPPTVQADVIVDTPQPNDLITSPLIVKGRAKGTWYFEANLPVTLKDTNGNVLAQKGFMTADNWMTTNYAEFNDTLTFSTPATQYGVLIIEKDNPSGEPQNDASFAVPVRFW